MYLEHHGILGMRWGKRNGPPYPLDANDHSASERKAGWRKSLDGGSSSTEKKRKPKAAVQKGKWRFRKTETAKTNVKSDDSETQSRKTDKSKDVASSKSKTEAPRTKSAHRQKLEDSFRKSGMSQQEAEKRMEALFALASSQNPR